MRLFSTLLALNITILILYFINIILWVLLLALPSNPDPVIILNVRDSNYFNENSVVQSIPWIFEIWSLVYLWQLIWIIFTFYLTFQFQRYGPPVLLTPTFLGLFLFSLILQIGVTVGGRFVAILAFVLLFLLAIFLMVCLVLTQLDLYKSRELLVQQNRKLDDSLIRGLVHNGLGLYAVWVAILTLMNLPVIVFFGSTFQDLDSILTIVLGLVGIYALIINVLDFVFDKYSRYTFTTFVPSIWFAVSSVLYTTGLNLIIAWSYLGLSIVVFISKIVFVVIHMKERPLKPPFRQ